MTLRMRLPCQAATIGVARRALDAALVATEVGADSRERLCLALSEACTNAVRHGGVEVYDVSVRADSNSCVIDVTDRGRGTDPAEFDRPAGRPDQIGGRGFHLMRRLVDVVTLQAIRPSGTLVHMVKRLAPGD